MSFTWCCTVLLAATTAFAQISAESKKSTDAEFVAPFLGGRTFAVVKIDFGNVALPDLSKALPTLRDEKQLQQLKTQAHMGLTFAQSLADGKPVFAAVSVPATSNGDETFVFRQVTTTKNTSAVIESLKAVQLETTLEKEYLIATPADVAKKVKYPAPESFRKAVASGFETVADFPVQVIVVPPDYIWRTIDELSRELPDQLGGGPSSVLTQGVQWVAIGLNSKELKLEATIQSTSAEAARAFAAHLPKMLSAAVESSDATSQLPEKVVRAALASIKPEVKGDQVVIRLELLADSKENLAFFAAIAENVEREIRLSNETEDFKRLLLAMHNYHDVYGHFPVPLKARNKKGEPLLSWRVHLLPFLEQNALYNQFKLDEPWDSDHNKKLIEKMPAVFASNSIDVVKKLKPGYTTYLAPVGEKTVYGGPKPTRIQNIIDGTSNTVIVVEVQPESAVPWTAPQDYRFDEEKPLAGVAVGKTGWIAGFADGSVRTVRKAVPPKTVLYLFQMNDGNVVENLE